MHAFLAAGPLGSNAVIGAPQALHRAESPQTSAALAVSLERKIAELEKAGASHGEVIVLLKRLIAGIKADERRT